MTTESTAPAKQLFYVLALDKTTEGTFETRKAVKEDHKVVAHKQIADGVIRFGGGLLSPEPVQPGATRKTIGSTMVYEAESIEEVRAIIESDVYYKSGVWDPERLIIAPFVAATKI